MVSQRFFQLGASADHSTWGVVGMTLEWAAPADIYPSYTSVQPFNDVGEETRCNVKQLSAGATIATLYGGLV